ncbi:MAG: DUF4389 domain-containing protein [Dehalococcoidia bacterium]
MATSNPYPVRLDIDYPERLGRLSTLLRLVFVIPILVILVLVGGGGGGTQIGNRDDARVGSVEGARVRSVEGARSSGAGAGILIGAATALMIVFRQKYPRWWFDFQRELARFTLRVGAYALLLRDEYPSTDEEQAVHLEIDYPDARALNRWLPLVKWLLALPHYIVLVFLAIGVLIAVIVAWVAILLTGRYPRALFDYVVGVERWGERVCGYMLYLVTDRYPPFSLR